MWVGCSRCLPSCPSALDAGPGWRPAARLPETYRPRNSSPRVVKQVEAPLHQRPRRPHHLAEDHGVLGNRHRLPPRVIARKLPAAVLAPCRPLDPPLRRPQHEELPVSPPRPVAVDQDRASRRERGCHGLAPHPENRAQGQVQPEALQPVAAESHDAGVRYQVPGRPPDRRCREFEHLDRARAQRLPALPLEQRAASSPRQASCLPDRCTAVQLRKQAPEPYDQGALAAVVVRLVLILASGTPWRAPPVRGGAGPGHT